MMKIKMLFVPKDISREGMGSGLNDKKERGTGILHRRHPSWGKGMGRNA